MKVSILLFLALLGHTARAQVSDTALVENFTDEHSASSYRVYCRDEVKVPECRTLITFVRKEDGRDSEAFQISFSAPAKPFAATELFIPLGEVSNGSGLFRNFVDKTMDGSFKTSSTSQHEIIKINGQIIISDLPFGSLSFSDLEAIVTLKDGNQIVYSRMKK